MRVAQVVGRDDSAQPWTDRGTKQVVTALCRRLARHGHEVTLFASSDEDDAGEDWPRLEWRPRAELSPRSNHFDLIHHHLEDPEPSPEPGGQTPSMYTVHGRLDRSTIRRRFTRYQNVDLVSVSRSQRQPVADLSLRWLDTIPNGLDVNRYTASYSPGDYLAFVGRISPETDPVSAVEIAERTGLPLRVMGAVDPEAWDYWTQIVKPLFRSADVDWVGDLDGPRRSAFLGDAIATVFPVERPEPHGLAAAESLACGTPVVGPRRGSVAEVVDDGQVGVLCDGVDAMCDAIDLVARLDRTACRRAAKHFDSERMAQQYESVFERVVNEVALSQ